VASIGNTDPRVCPRTGAEQNVAGNRCFRARDAYQKRGIGSIGTRTSKKFLIPVACSGSDGPIARDKEKIILGGGGSKLTKAGLKVRRRRRNKRGTFFASGFFAQRILHALDTTTCLEASRLRLSRKRSKPLHAAMACFAFANIILAALRLAVLVPTRIS
jgi:hypothetical protein